MYLPRRTDQISNNSCKICLIFYGNFVVIQAQKLKGLKKEKKESIPIKMEVKQST